MEGYKFLQVKNPCCGTIHLALVKLEIPDDAIVVYPVDKDYYLTTDFIEEPILSLNYKSSIKCRCNKAKIVEVIQYYDVFFNIYTAFYELIETSLIFDLSRLTFRSLYDDQFCYKFNKYVEPDTFDNSIHTECSHGIHFCKTIADAKKFMACNGYRFSLRRNIC